MSDNGKDGSHKRRSADVRLLDDVLRELRAVQGDVTYMRGRMDEYFDLLGDTNARHEQLGRQLEGLGARMASVEERVGKLETTE